MTVQKKAAGVISTGGAAENRRATFSHPQDTTLEPSRQPVHGRVRGGVWRKTVRASVHMLRHPPAWALDAADLDLAEAAGARWVSLREQERGITYRAPIERIRSKGISLDRGYGKQLALSLGHWVTDVPEPESERKGAVVQEALL